VLTQTDDGGYGGVLSLALALSSFVEIAFEKGFNFNSLSGIMAGIGALDYAESG